MALTLRWLLAQSDLQTSLLEGDESTEFEFVQTTDQFDPRSNLIGGELVLITGLGFPDGPATDADHFELYIERLAECGVSALGVGVGSVFRVVPESLIYAARQHGMPLLEVPPTTRFANITKLVMRHVADQQYADVAWSTKQQSKLNRSMARDGLVGLVKALADATEGSAALVTQTGHVLAQSGPRSEDAVVEARQSLHRGAGSGSTETPDYWSITHMVHAEGTVVAALSLVRRPALPPLRRLFITHAVSLAEIYLDKPEQLRLREDQFRSKILMALLDGNMPFEATVVLLEELGYGRGTVRALCLLGPATFDSTLRRHLAKMLLPMNHPLYLVQRDSSSSDDGVWVVLLRQEVTSDQWTNFLPPGERSARGAVSRPAEIRSVRAMVEEARLLAYSARPGTIVSDRPTTGPLVLEDPALKFSLQQRGELLLEPIRREDSRSGSELLKTLHTWLLEGCYAERTARRLGVHRHTLRTRLDIIASLLPVDLDSATQRAELLLALVALFPAKQ